jgi:hypothetical protein
VQRLPRPAHRVFARVIQGHLCATEQRDELTTL